MTIVTRFAPSPTGYLHVGSARTALFNFLYARHNKGKVLLRIEDTDKARSTEELTNALLEGLEWLNINCDGEVIFQSNNIKRHQEVAEELVKIGKAYYCLTPLEDIQQKREKAQKEGKVYVFQSEWRDKNLQKDELPTNNKAVIRLKAPKEDSTTIADLVQGEVTVENNQLDDMVLLRSDGTPIYMLAVVVDDYDMGVTHVIRGDDHLNNAFRQIQIYKALDWKVPQYAHIPLIHGEDGARLSKRHGAVGVEQYRELGYLPEALSNYLLRLGWSHGDDEIISREDAIKWFDLKDVNKAAARIDYNKMLHINAHYIMHADNDYLIELMKPLLKTELNKEQLATLSKGLNGLKIRAKTILELAEQAAFYISDEPLSLNEDAANLLTQVDKKLFQEVFSVLDKVDNWDEETLKSALKALAKERNLKLGQIAPGIRAALTGTTNAPGIFEIMPILGKAKSLLRMRYAIQR
jgi:glutamyl-tRNA synthetase